ncbi:hypothetical protein OK351_12040 [Glutamicibacter sp. MNS18]|uniref:hypothetical protein n=1 Tax=Glutamicibacter sp. MNS18 TaxID=2989817 RepID=UPI0022360D53|nr:hypothetical protein [Glutamicibacter sp. MNS18]MCW4466228.1 hypothetical protein [Glutamicibacter sp. MNS18]
MSTEEFNVLSLSFHYRGRRAEAGQRVYEALSALDLVGYCGSSDAGDHFTFVAADLAMDEYEVPLTANAAGELSFAKGSTEELAKALLEASGADSIYLDGELAAGEELDLDDEAAFEGMDQTTTPQVVAGPRLPRSELAMSSVGQGGGWKLREDQQGLLAVREGESVDIVLGRKMVPAVDIIRHEDVYQIRLHARSGTLNVAGSVALEYWMSTGERAVPAVASGSPAAKLQQDLGLWLHGADTAELEELEELWPEAAAAVKVLCAERTEAALRDFIRSLDLPEQIVDLANGDPVPSDFEDLRGGMVTGLNLALEEEISSAQGIWKLVYRTGWSPTALITSSLGVIAAGVLFHRWMKLKGKPGTGWRRTIMFFWYSDAAYYLARGVRDALRKKH